MTIEAELPDGTILEFPDGTDQAVIQNAVKQILSGQQQQPAQQAPSMGLEQFGQGVDALGLEAVSAANRGIASLLDTFGVDTINAALQVGGFEARVPTFTGNITEPKGAFTQGTEAEGLPTDIVAGAGEMAVNALGGQGLIRQGARNLAPLAQNAGARVVRELAKPGLASTAGFGAASGAGEEVGREAGGETGALVGAVAAPIAGVAAVQGGKALIGKLTEKLGRNIGLIDSNTGLPTPVFEKALRRRGLDFGSVVNDVDSLPVVSGRRSADQVVEQITRRKLLDGATDDGLAVLRLQGNSIVSDELGEEALKQGFRAGDVAAAKAPNRNTKNIMSEMLNMNRQILSNSSKAQDFRPTDEVGNQVMSKFSFIRGKADALRNDLDNIANKAGGADPTRLSGPGVSRGLKGLEINGGKVEDSVLSGLRKLNLNISDDILNDTRLLPQMLKDKGAFIGSDISKDRTSQRVIKDVIDLLSEPGTDALRAHKLKRQLDSLIDFNKKSSQGLTEAGRNFAKDIRFSLNQVIREVSPQYAKINDELSLSIQTMNEFQRVLGPSIDVFSPGARKAVGQDLRGLLSNRKSRVSLENSINGINDTAQKLGGDFDVNIKDLVQFANTLDDRFGAVAKNSLKGEVESVVNEGVRLTAVKKVAQQAEKLRGINDTNAFNVMQKILKR